MVRRKAKAEPSRTASRLVALAPIAVLALGFVGAHRLGAAPVRHGEAIMKVADVKPGMKGHAVTVFEGESSDRFEIEVVDVIKNYLPKQDAILFRSTDPR